MRSLVVNRCQVDGLPAQALADPGKPAELVPRLWPQLPPVVQKQLAQQLAQLLQRLRAAGESSQETYDAKRSNGR
jgi:hypothetical protein